MPLEQRLLSFRWKFSMPLRKHPGVKSFLDFLQSSTAVLSTISYHLEWLVKTSLSY